MLVGLHTTWSAPQAKNTSYAPDQATEMNWTEVVIHWLMNELINMQIRAWFRRLGNNSIERKPKKLYYNAFTHDHWS